MEREGPVLETLTRRLAETPVEFLDEPRVAAAGTVRVAALVHDLLRLHGHRVDASALRRYVSGDARADRNRLMLVQVTTWLLADDWFVDAKPAREGLLQVLDQAAAELVAGGSADRFVHDAERREELARTALARLGYRPAGEARAEATDRLSSISGVERARLLEAARSAEERARAIREALAKKAAAESADKWTRE
ncbi:hypothetical protein KPL74_21695 [Bacillus sp. NP157]|nr:hypothetical protein KPL74_21695 [Bacillus sp. NP157]